MSKEESHLLLKWGTVKGWDNLGDTCAEILNRYFADGVPMGCASDRPCAARREILCELIDSFGGTITNEWTGKGMSREEAKKYVREYK